MATPARERILHSSSDRRENIFSIANLHAFVSLMQTITTTTKAKKKNLLRFFDSLIARMSKYDGTEIEEEKKRESLRHETDIIYVNEFNKDFCRRNPSFSFLVR